MTDLCLAFEETARLFFEVILPFDIPTGSV